MAMNTPSVPVSFVPAKEGDILGLAGGVVCRIQEDGSNTDNRVGCAEFTIPPKTPGPPPHWHKMHDETFLVTKGTVRFHAKDGARIDAKVGDLIVVPPEAPHTFENASDEEAAFFNVFTPAYYVHYFKLMDTWVKEGQPFNREMILKAQALYATIPVVGGKL